MRAHLVGTGGMRPPEGETDSAKGVRAAWKRRGRWALHGLGRRRPGSARSEVPEDDLGMRDLDRELKPEPPRPASTNPITAECAICLDDSAEYAVVPCGHRCLCNSCIKAVSECPVCRGAMTAVLRVFI